MPRVIHFEINCDDTEKAVEFYQKTFGWGIKKWDGPEEYWLINTGDDNSPGINGAIMRRQNPGVSTVNIVDVESIDTSMENVKSNGGEVISQKTVIPSVGYFCYCRDTEGNTFGMMQADDSVKQY